VWPWRTKTRRIMWGIVASLCLDVNIGGMENARDCEMWIGPVIQKMQRIEGSAE
jgi:hypothetical protein